MGIARSRITIHVEGRDEALTVEGRLALEACDKPLPHETIPI